MDESINSPSQGAYRRDECCAPAIPPAKMALAQIFLKETKSSMTQGPIIIVEDDKDDQYLYTEAIQSIGIVNEVRFFPGADPVLEYLNTTEEQPFIILSDINMPGKSGLELKKAIQDDPYLRAKGIPFVFISTNATAVSVRHAHALSVQGYFEEPNHMEGIIQMLQTLFTYWMLCRHINNT